MSTKSFVTKEDRGRNYVLSAILWRTDRVVFVRRRDYEVIKQSHARLLLGRQMFRKRPVTPGAYGTSGKTTKRVDLYCRFLPILLRNVIILEFPSFVYAKSSANMVSEVPVIRK